MQVETVWSSTTPTRSTKGRSVRRSSVALLDMQLRQSQSRGELVVTELHFAARNRIGLEQVSDRLILERFRGRIFRFGKECPPGLHKLQPASIELAHASEVLGVECLTHREERSRSESAHHLNVAPPLVE